MTDTPLAVTQEDKHAAEWIVPVKCCADKRWIASLEQAFAAHRQAAEQRARIEGALSHHRRQHHDRCT